MESATREGIKEAFLKVLSSIKPLPVEEQKYRRKLLNKIQQKKGKSIMQLYVLWEFGITNDKELNEVFPVQERKKLGLAR